MMMTEDPSGRDANPGSTTTTTTAIWIWTFEKCVYRVWTMYFSKEKLLQFFGFTLISLQSLYFIFPIKMFNSSLSTNLLVCSLNPLCNLIFCNCAQTKIITIVKL
jgi:hypothetical protein